MKKIICLVICILLICVFFIGKHLNFMERTTSLKKVSDEQKSAAQNLRISFATNIDASFSIPVERGDYREVTCLGIENVTIDVDGIVMDLEDALLDGDISVDEMIADARLDSQLGICKEVAKSKNGLTEFTYYYQEFRLRYIYDIYETPDGKQHLITDCLIYGIGHEPHFLSPNDETGKYIDSEDWGLMFDVLQSNPTSINIKCTQFGGQQIGMLYVGDHILYRKDSNTRDLELIQPLTKEWEINSYNEIKNKDLSSHNYLTMGGSTELFFDFSLLYGQLHAGDYVIHLQIVDLYKDEDMHPLMRNYYDMQWYEISFTIQ